MAYFEIETGSDPVTLNEIRIHAAVYKLANHMRIAFHNVIDGYECD